MSIRLLTGKSSSSGGCFSWRKHRLKQRQISSFCLAKQAPQGGKYPSWRFSLVPDTYIQKTKKLYIDSRARRNLGSINTELQDVQRIMVANIEEVLQRGEALSGTRGGCCLAYAYPQSVTWVEHIRWKVFLIPRSPWKSNGLSRCIISVSCILKHLMDTGATSECLTTLGGPGRTSTRSQGVLSCNTAVLPAAPEKLLQLM